LLRPNPSGGVAAALALALVSFGTPCRADPQSPERDITVGPSLAWAFGAPDEGVLVGAEFSYLPGGPFWFTLGGRVLSAAETTGLAHAEAGVWLFATWGIGYSRRLWGRAFDGDSLELFVGEPLPFAEAFDSGMFFAEPYYRPTFGLSSGDVVHELGLMLKFTTFQ